ncbi:UvrD-helicase domain-containing protein [Exiguobacterium sp. TRN 1102]|uniref:UvrD-helicase domain-containing protein n=1 Tax=Exiguobacterium sp. TRN 1102 TaxID=3420732 RepID=UPI003D772FBD
MKLFIEERFYKTVPIEKREEVNRRISYLLESLYKKDFNFNKLPAGLDFKKIQALDKVIYKFRVNSGDRILCARSEDLYSQFHEEDQNALVLLEYCTHDTQIRVAKAKDFSNQAHLDASVLPVEILKPNLPSYLVNYSLSTSYSFIKDFEIDSKELFNIFGDEAVFYCLDENQKAIVQSEQKTQFIFGSAGSGKTTLSIYRILQLLNNMDEEFIKIAHFTYSSKLKQQTEALFMKIATKMSVLSEKELKKRVNFYTVEEYIEKTHSDKTRLVTFEIFKDWYVKQKNLPKLDLLALWKERRGILQGSLGTRWQYELEIPIIQEGYELLKQLESESLISFSEKELTFTIRSEFVNIQKKLQHEPIFLDKLKKQMITSLNAKLIDIPSLSKENYFKLKNRDSIFTLEERKKAITIYEKFDIYITHLNKLDYFEEGALIREVLEREVSPFDYILIDEVQDLTELQFYFLLQKIDSTENLFVCGDLHQTINPTYFNVGRIQSLYRFVSGNDMIENKILDCNYRSSENIVNFANELSQFRREVFSTNHEWDYIEIPQRSATKPPYLFKGEVDNIFEHIQDKGYVYVIVVNEQNKEKLLARYPYLESRVMTVSEAKGIENKHIITYNVFSSYVEEWRNIFLKKDYKLKLNTELYRYYFNIVYVAITRARDVLGMIEDNLTYDLERWLSQHMEIMTEFDEDALDLAKQSSPSDLLKSAIQLENNENFAQATATYRLIQNTMLAVEASKGIARCNIKEECQRTKDYLVCGRTLVTHEEYEQAIPYLKRANDELFLLKAILNIDQEKNLLLINEELRNFVGNPLVFLNELGEIELISRYTNLMLLPTEKRFNKLLNTSKKLLRLSQKTSEIVRLKI